MTDILDYIYGPLPKKYCIWFYFLSIIGFVFFIFALVSYIILAVKKRRDGAFYLQAFSVLAVYGIFYFQNRLLHGMCIHSL
jgi:hypothetical protein